MYLLLLQEENFAYFILCHFALFRKKWWFRAC